MANEQAVIKINCILDGQTAERFLKIKEAKGIKQKTEVVRLAINECYKKIVKEA